MLGFWAVIEMGEGLCVIAVRWCVGGSRLC